MNEINVPWKGQNNVWWNETCARIVDHFGLPGDRYRTEVSTESMKFIFNNEKGAFMCQMMISEEL